MNSIIFSFLWVIISYAIKKARTPLNTATAICVLAHIPNVSSRGAPRPANARKAFGYPTTIQLAQDDKINFVAPLLNAPVVLIPQGMGFLSVLL